MADPERRLRIWYNPEGDYLEVIFDQKPGVKDRDRVFIGGEEIKLS